MSEAWRFRAQQQFNRRAALVGHDLTLVYAGPWTRDAATGAVNRVAIDPPLVTLRGHIATKVVGNAYLSEKLLKWGASFVPDGMAILPIGTPLENLVQVQDNSAGGAVYEIILAMPDTFGEGVYRTVFFRHGEVYNRRVRVMVEDRIGDDDLLLFTNLPCRIFYAADSDSSSNRDETGDDSLTLLQARPLLEVPFVYEGVNAAGAGLVPALTPGATWFLEDKFMEVSDTPSEYGEAGFALKYVVNSANLDPGGDRHHERYLLGLRNL